jgi:hypothetical protein
MDSIRNRRHRRGLLAEPWMSGPFLPKSAKQIPLGLGNAEANGEFTVS